MTTASAYHHCPSPSLGYWADTAHSQRLGRDTRRIACTDRVYACLVMAGRVVAEFTGDSIDGYTALLTVLRSMVPACRGLARLRLRNMTRGWVMERQIMFRGSRG